MRPQRRYVPRHVRRAILRRTDGRCTYCDRVLGPDTGVVLDHVIPFVVSHRDEHGNLTAACTRCNARAGSRVLGNLQEKRTILRVELGLPVMDAPPPSNCRPVADWRNSHNSVRARAANRSLRLFDPVTRTCVIGAATSPEEQLEILRALEVAGFPSASEGAREVLLGYARNVTAKAA